MSFIYSLVELGYPESQIILLGHGIEINNFRKSSNLEMLKKIENRGSATILMVGRLSWEKNYLLAFKIIAELVKKCPELNVVIAGTGPDLNSLLEIRNELNLEGTVELVGWQPNIAKLMFEADLFLHLSLTESYGQVLLEACLCNLPVFTFPVGIALDLEKDRNPFIHILNSRNPIEISDGIFDFLNDNENRFKDQVPPTLKEHDIDYIHSAMATYLVAECNK